MLQKQCNYYQNPSFLLPPEIDTLSIICGETDRPKTFSEALMKDDKGIFGSGSLSRNILSEAGLTLGPVPQRSSGYGFWVPDSSRPWLWLPVLRQLCLRCPLLSLSMLSDLALLSSLAWSGPVQSGPVYSCLAQSGSICSG